MIKRFSDFLNELKNTDKNISSDFINLLGDLMVEILQPIEENDDLPF